MKDANALSLETGCHPLEDLLDKDKSVSVHVKNIKTLAIEIFKVSNKLTVPSKK